MEGDWYKKLVPDTKCSFKLKDLQLREFLRKSQRRTLAKIVQSPTSKSSSILRLKRRIDPNNPLNQSMKQKRHITTFSEAINKVKQLVGYTDVKKDLYWSKKPPWKSPSCAKEGKSNLITIKLRNEIKQHCTEN
jgi:hypothetical protein